MGYEHAHGAFALNNDKAKTTYIKFAFENRKGEVGSIKSMIGYYRGEAGEYDVAARVMAARYGILAPTINHTTKDSGCYPDAIPEFARNADI